MSGFLETVDLFRGAFLGALLIGLTCGLLGVHLVGRRMVLVGLALPQAATLGVVTGLALGATEQHVHEIGGPLPHVLALGFVVLGTILVSSPAVERAIGRATASGMLFAICGAATVLMLPYTYAGPEEVHHLVEGNVLAMEGGFGRLAAVLIPCLIVLAISARRLAQCTFDAEGAATLGVHTRRWDLVFQGLLALCVATAVHAAGTLFVFGFLVIPGAAAQLLGSTVARAYGAALAVAAIGAVGGVAVSVSELDLPTGPACVATAAVVLGVAALVNKLLPGG